MSETFGSIFKEVYGPRIVEQLEKETFIGSLLGKQEPFIGPTKPWWPDRDCTEDDLTIYGSDYGDVDISCNNCHKYTDLTQGSPWSEILDQVKNFEHLPRY